MFKNHGLTRKAWSHEQCFKAHFVQGRFLPWHFVAIYFRNAHRHAGIFLCVPFLLTQNPHPVPHTIVLDLLPQATMLELLFTWTLPSAEGTFSPYPFDFFFTHSSLQSFDIRWGRSLTCFPLAISRLENSNAFLGSRYAVALSCVNVFVPRNPPRPPSSDILRISAPWRQHAHVATISLCWVGLGPLQKSFPPPPSLSPPYPHSHHAFICFARFNEES